MTGGTPNLGETLGSRVLRSSVAREKISGPLFPTDEKRRAASFWRWYTRLRETRPVKTVPRSNGPFSSRRYTARAAIAYLRPRKNRAGKARRNQGRTVYQWREGGSPSDTKILSERRAPGRLCRPRSHRGRTRSDRFRAANQGNNRNDRFQNPDSPLSPLFTNPGKLKAPRVVPGGMKHGRNIGSLRSVNQTRLKAK